MGGLADEAADLPDIIDEAGMFLIQEKEYEDGIALYRSAVERFPDSPALYAGCACCAGHMEWFDEALEAAERAVDLDPANPSFVNDLGWTLLLAGRLDEACEVLERAMDMNPADELARENLKRCQEDGETELFGKTENAAGRFVHLPINPCLTLNHFARRSPRKRPGWPRSTRNGMRRWQG